MKINNITNTSFKSIYYEGRYVGKDWKDGKEGIHFEIRNKRPDYYLSPKQQIVTRAIEDMIDKAEVDFFYSDGSKGEFKSYLVPELADKKTDVYFRYPNSHTVETEIVKWGIGDWGDEYCYNPYNKKMNKKIKMVFSLYFMPSIKRIQNKTNKFISDCEVFLSDKDNKRNKGIEKMLAAEC